MAENRPRWRGPSTRGAFGIGLLLALVVMCAWAVASPLGSSPDENYHLASIWCAAGTLDGRCEDPRPAQSGSITVPIAVVAGGCSAHDPAKSGACALGLEPEEFGVVPKADVNFFAGHYPNGYYRAVNRFLVDDVTVSGLGVRLFNALLCVALVFATIALVGRRLRVAFILSWLACLVPLGLFIVPSVNPSSLGVTAAGVSWAAALGLAEARSFERRVGLLMVLSICLLAALLSRLDAVVFMALAAVAGLALSPRVHGIARRHSRGVLLGSGGVAALVVGVTVLGPSSQSSFITDPLSGFTRGGADLLFANLAELPSLWAGIFGTWGLGQLDTALPPIVWALSLFAVSALVFTGLAKLWRAKAVVLGGLGALLIAIPLLTLQARNEPVGTFLQPRYLLPLVLVAVGVTLVCRRQDPLRLSRVQCWLLGAAWVVAATFALHRLMRRYVTGLDVGAWNLNAGREWWWDIPVPPLAVWIVASCAFAGLVATALTYVRHYGSEGESRRAMSTRALIVSPFAPPHRGGLESYIEWLREALAEYGATTRVLSTDVREADADYVVSAWDIPVGGGTSWPLVIPTPRNRGIIREALAWADMVIHQNCFWNLTAIVSREAARSSKRQFTVVHAAHRTYPGAGLGTSMFAWAFGRTVGRAQLRRAPAIAVSESTQRFVEYEYATHARLARCPLPPVRAATPSASTSSPARAARIAWVGRLVPVKAPTVAIAVGDGLAAALPIEMHIYGDGPLATALPSRPWLHVHGALPRDEVLAEIANADVFLSTSRADNVQVALLEALALGVPCVATSVGEAVSYMTGDLGDGLVPVDDVPAMVLALRTVLAEPERYRAAAGQRGEDLRALHDHSVAAARIAEVLGLSP